MYRKNLILVFAAMASCLLAGDIENGKRPSGAPVTLTFTEELTIGPESDAKGTIWSGLHVAVTVDEKGHMFVTDSDENRIVEFDANGSFVAIHGREGQGPGEFQSLSRFQILNDGSGVAFENRQNAAINYFNADMTFKNRKRLHNQGTDFLYAVFSPHGKLFSADVVVNNEQKMTHTIRKAIYDTNMIMKKVVSDQVRPMPNYNELLNDRSGIIEYLGNMMSGNDSTGLVAYDAEGRVYTANPKAYEITVWSPDLKTVERKITRDYEPITKSEAEIQAICSAVRDQLPFPDFVMQRINAEMMVEAFEQAEIPRIKNPLFGLIPMEDGGLLAIHDVNATDGSATADIFNAKGEYTGQVTMPNQSFIGGPNLFGANKVRMIFANGKAYTVELREGENVLVRYQVKLSKPS